jgi:hypothetical protein
MGLFLLFCSLKSIARCSPSSPWRFFADDRRSHEHNTNHLVLVILLFSFDSAGQVKARRQHNNG